MEPNPLARIIDEQDRLDPVAEKLSGAVENVYSAAGPQARNFMHGVWVGHPLHPILTDIPIGAWTVACGLDALERVTGITKYRKGADAAVGIGLIGATGAALTGLTDWHVFAEEKPKRTGMVHMLFNTVAAGLFTASWFLRKGRRRDAAHVCSIIGYAALVGGAFLGGQLVYEQGVGVDHAQREGGPEEFAPVCDETQLVENKPIRVDVNGISVMVVKQNGQIFAIGDVCSHFGGPLSEGKVEDGSVSCPWHASTFSLADGRVLRGPATFCQAAFETRVVDGKVEIRKRRVQTPQKPIESRTYMA